MPYSVSFAHRRRRSSASIVFPRGLLPQFSTVSIICTRLCMCHQFLTLTIVGKFPDGDARRAPKHSQASTTRRCLLIDGVGTIKAAGGEDITVVSMGCRVRAVILSSVRVAIPCIHHIISNPLFLPHLIHTTILSLTLLLHYTVLTYPQLQILSNLSFLNSKIFFKSIALLKTLQLCPQPSVLRFQIGRAHV